jgi:hypothetical protein
MARAAKWEDSTSGTEVVLSCACVPLVQREIVERREEAKLVLLYAVNQRSAPATN